MMMMIKIMKIITIVKIILILIRIRMNTPPGIRNPGIRNESLNKKMVQLIS